MNNPPSTAPEAGGANSEETSSALFAQMVLQQTNLAMMLMGQSRHPQSGQIVQDLEGARMFIDQLEMIEVKTKGNLSKEEAGLLRQSLTALRLAFVEAVESPAPAKPGPTPPAGPAPEVPENKPNPETTAAELELKKKFSKKY
jgi:hypothetical protein